MTEKFNSVCSPDILTAKYRFPIQFRFDVKGEPIIENIDQIKDRKTVGII